MARTAAVGGKAASPAAKPESPAGGITADEARALVQAKHQAIQRQGEIDAVRYHGLVAERIRVAASNGETELHRLMADIPPASRMPIIRMLQERGFEVHDDMYGGVVMWPLPRSHEHE